MKRGLEVFPTNKIRYTDANITPYIEAYYLLGEALTDEAGADAATVSGINNSSALGDKLLMEYANNLMEYLRYYSQFNDVQFAMVQGEVNDRKNSLDNLLYNVAIKYNRTKAIESLSNMLKEMGYSQSELDYLVAESYYYYGIYNDIADKMIIDIINDEVAVIEEFFKVDEQDVTPAQQQRTVDAMYTLEDFYSLTKQYSRGDIMSFLNDYLLSIGYDEEALSQL